MSTIGLRDLRHRTRESIELAHKGMVTVTDHGQVAGYILAPVHLMKSPDAASMKAPRLRAIVEWVDTYPHQDVGTQEFLTEQRQIDRDLERTW